jgi:SynChlorMet cassette radical SAM/SPASM protein ScmE
MSRQPLKAPASVDIALTGRCNLACKHCYYAEEMVAHSDLPTESWLGFFAELRDAGVMSVTLTGGEVFTRPDLWELLEGVVRNKLRFCILTNATLISAQVAQRLAGFRRRVDYVQVSVDGSCPATHDALRGPGAFDRMLCGMAALQQAGLPWTVRVTVSKLNVHDLKATLQMLQRDVGVESLGVNEAYPMGAGHCNHSALEMTREERREAFRVMREFDREYPGVARGSSAGPLIMAELIEKVDRARATGQFEESYPTGHLTACNAMWQSLAVLHDGTYVPCHQLAHLALGKVGQDALLDVWHNAPGLRALRERCTIPLDADPRCIGCGYQVYCTGGCPGVAYAVTGDVNRTNPRDCYRAHVGEDPVYAY